MQANEHMYPASPAGGGIGQVQVSPRFRGQAVRVMAAIIFFLVVYLALVTVAAVLALYSAYGGIRLIMVFPRFITIAIGVGMIGVGLMVVYFLIRFIFASNKTDRSGMIEITEREQPRLFAFIRRLTAETQTPFPKRVYLSPDVNASVFYDSSFWSMFLPVRKNLLIGLGLVNVVNMGEFKAILAHEFGHFSQRSMKLGSYVYNVNRIIYSMVYENTSYTRLLEEWANIYWIFSLMALITNLVIAGIRWIMNKVYAVVNLTYQRLSREMEFHADAIAASVSGSEQLVGSLYRLEVAQLCYQRLLEEYNGWLPEQWKADNMYPQHSEVIRHFAHDLKLEIRHGLIYVDADSFKRFSQSRVVVKDQWASHPDNEDREAHLRQLGFTAAMDSHSAWDIFNDAEDLQRRMTEKMYASTRFEGGARVLDLATFRDKFAALQAKGSYPEAYNDYYDGRFIKPFEPVLEAQELPPAENNLQELITEEMNLLPRRVKGLHSDKETLEAIRDRRHRVGSFDFDGKKYRRRQAGEVLSQLEEELAQAEDLLDRQDKKIFRFFLERARKQHREDELKAMYSRMFELDRQQEANMEIYRQAVMAAQPLFAGQNMNIEQAYMHIANIRTQERRARAELRTILDEADSGDFIRPHERATIEKFLVREEEYIMGETFMNSAFRNLWEALELFVKISTERRFMQEKKLLELQLELAGPRIDV